MSWRRVAAGMAVLIAALFLIPSCGTAPAAPERGEIIVGEWQYDSGPTVAVWTACTAFGDRLYVTNEGVAATPGGCRR